MDILFNATTIGKGGGLQRAVAVVREIIADPLGHRWHVAISEIIARELDDLPGNACGKFHVFPASPARHRSSRRRLMELEHQLQPNCTFTLAGPAYVRFQSRHLTGITDAWVTHPSWRAIRTLAFPREWATTMLTSVYKSYWLRHAQGWVVQTETARQGLHRWLRVPLDQIFVVGNGCSSLYVEGQGTEEMPGPRTPLRILCFAAPYKHKRLDLVPCVARELRRLAPTLDFKFVLTLPEGDIVRQVTRRAEALQVASLVENIGPVPVRQGPRLYHEADICFLPTVLETFSATYAESMAMGVPMITTDLSFARDVCKDGVYYFEPDNPLAAATAIYRVYQDEPLRRSLIAAGRRVVADMLTSSAQYRKFVAILEQFVHGTSARVQWGVVAGNTHSG